MTRAAILTAALLATLPAARAEDNVYKKGLKSTVWIVQVTQRTGTSFSYRSGSGALIDATKKLVLTNHHVVGGMKEATVFFPSLDKKGELVPEKTAYLEAFKAGGGIPGKVLFTDPTRDLAVIQLASVPKGAPALRLAKDGVGPGDRVHSIGSPGASGALFNYTDGSVKSVYQKKFRTSSGPNDPNGFVIDARVIETSSSTNRGDSGGPLMNDAGDLVGVTQGIMIGDEATRPISYFIDVSEVRTALKANKIALTPTGSAATTAAAAKPADKPGEAPAAPAKSKKQMETEAAGRLGGARLFLKSNPKQARELLEEVVELYPTTDAAAEAKKLLATLK